MDKISNNRQTDKKNRQKKQLTDKRTEDRQTIDETDKRTDRQKVSQKKDCWATGHIDKRIDIIKVQTGKKKDRQNN